jgi:uncharacterized Fe-S cluster-containing radical SAM superfamily protein
MEGFKRRHYAKVVALHHYQMLPFVVETCGGMGPKAETLVELMAEAGEAHLRMWTKNAIIHELLHTVAIAVQRGSAVAYLHGYERALHSLRMTHAAKTVRIAAARQKRREEDQEELDEQSEGNSALTA